MMRILAIFTCYNRRDLTERGIGTLRANEQVAFDYVIVNDGSTDGTETMLASLPDRIDVVQGRRRLILEPRDAYGD